MPRLQNLAKHLLSEASSPTYNPELSTKLTGELSEVLTADLGITSFEFEHSGILKAIQIYLTSSASQAKTQSVNDEESKSAPSSEISKREAKALILRLR